MKLSDLLNPTPPPKRPPQVEEESPGSTKKSTSSSALIKQQQAFLADIRSGLTRSIVAYLSEEKSIRERFELLLNRTQRGSWENLWDFLESIKSFELTPSTGAIVLGGWQRKPTCPTPPNSRLEEDVFAFGIYGGMLERINAIQKVSQSQRAPLVQEVWAWARRCSPAFESAREDGIWSVGSLRKLAESRVAALIPKIHEQLLFMPEDALIFYPNANDPSGGWKDFWDFVRGYNLLPDSIKNNFGSYFLIIQVPIKAAISK